MMMQIGMNDLDEADDTYTSLESEHRNSPYIPTAMLILLNAHIEKKSMLWQTFI
jgi:outer membrane protein assembly factor BamD